MQNRLRLMRNSSLFAVFVVLLIQPGWAATDPSEIPYSDTSVTIAVNLALDQEPGVSAHLIDVETGGGRAPDPVEDGVATLDGTVDSWVEYYAAEGKAYDTGAVVVRNRLRVTF